MLKTLAIALIATAGFAGAAQAQTPEQANSPYYSEGPTPGPRSGERADIPFAAYNGIRTFTSERQGRGVYLQDNRRNWYYASFFSRCTELPYAIGVGFKTFGGSSTLSRGDTIIVRGDACKIADIVRSGPPPEKPRKPRKARART
jgi:hypothetical protein